MWYRTAILLAPVALAAAQSGPVRQGAYWVETVNGSETVAPSGRLKVVSRGAVTVNGTDSGSLEYSLVKKVRARSEADARRLLSEFVFKTSHAGDLTQFTLSSGSGTGDLNIRVPRTLRWAGIETHGGRVEVVDLEGVVQASTGGGPMRLDRIGGQAVANTAGGEISLGAMRGPVHCSTAGGTIRAESLGAETTCDTAGGEIVVNEATGPLRVSTAGGSIRVARAGGTVLAETASGSIDVGEARGMVRAETAGGSIEVGAANGVRCESAGGGIRLAKASGSVRASTAVGSVMAQLLASGFSDGFLSTAAGDITVVIPSNLAVTIRAQNAAAGARRIVTEFPEIQVRVDGGQVFGEGSLNGGGPVLRLAGSGGTIYIKRQK